MFLAWFGGPISANFEYFGHIGFCTQLEIRIWTLDSFRVLQLMFRVNKSILMCVCLRIIKSISCMHKFATA